jgi:hypothetical protein
MKAKHSKQRKKWKQNESEATREAKNYITIQEKFEGLFLLYCSVNEETQSQ